MDRFEMTEKLREKVNVSYEEAKAALEANNWDLLEAIIYLEGRGAPRTAPAAREPQPQGEERKKESTMNENTNSFAQKLTNFFERLLEKGQRNRLEVHAGGKILLSTPLIFVAVAILLFWITIPAMIVGLFFGLRYRLTGPDMPGKVNDVMNTVADKAEDLRDSLTGKGGSAS